MTLYEFILLTEDEQVNIVWEGELFLSREEGEHKILLYKVYSFYVEVYYNSDTNKIEKFNPFSSKQRLNLYFDLLQN